MKQELQKLLSPYDQEHLLAFWDELDEAGRRQLTAQIRDIDFELLRSLKSGQATAENWAAKASRALPPPAARLGASDNTSKSNAMISGRESLDRGEVAVVIVAGGQGSRLGFEHPKGM